MGKTVRFRIDTTAKKPSARCVLPRPRSHPQPPPPTLSLKQRWGTLADNLQRLALLSPERVRGLEQIVAKALEQLELDDGH
jgi:hypothetical protein